MEKLELIPAHNDWLSQLGTSHRLFQKEKARVQAHLLSVGARKSVRVVTKKNLITGMQFKRINSSIGLNLINVYSIEEAEEELAKD